MFKSRIPLLLTLSLLLIASVFTALPGYNTSGQAASKTFVPSADAYVYATNPASNYGSAVNLRVDASPDTRSYLRFVVSGLNGAAVTSARLRMYANSANTTGYTVSTLSNNSWAENGITFSNAPAPGSAISTSPAITAGQWVEADVSSYIKAEGTYSLVLTTTSSTNTSLGSREAGGNAPQLVVTTATTAPTPTSIAATPTAGAVTPTAIPTVTATPPASLTKVNLTKGPVLIYTGSNTSMKIVWQWTTNTSFRVDWGTSPSYGASTSSISAYDTTNRMYSSTLTGLTPGTKYYYRVVVGNQYSDGSFFTAPSAGATSLKFVSYGDTRTNTGAHNTVAGQVVKLFQSDPGYQTLNLMEGDLVSSGDTNSTWDSEFFTPTMSNVRTEMANISDLSVMGNHEGSGALFKRYFPMPFVAGRYWSFDYGPMHVVMMDQYTSYGAGSAQYNWIKNDLAASTKKWKVIVLHEPGWSANGGHANNTTIQKTYQPLFEQYKVALVLGGHNHYYARAMVNGIAHLTVGTGGAPIYSPASGQPNVVKTYTGYGYTRFAINGSTLTGWFINSSGSTIDTFTLTR